MTSRCSYCNTPALVEKSNLPGLEPDNIIPFKIDKKGASEQFVEKTKKKYFLPNEFKKNIPSTQIGSTYISAMAFSMNVYATYSGVEREEKTVGFGKDQKTITHYNHFSGNVDKFFDNIVIECSDKINQNQINGVLPYNFQECYKYNNDFTSGYTVEYYNQPVENSKVVAEKQALKEIDKMIRAKYSNIDSLTINPTYSNHKLSYVLLPLYFINFKYKQKQYLNLMNGQTGKTYGKVPRSPVKITFFVLLMLAIFIGIPAIITMLTM